MAYEFYLKTIKGKKKAKKRNTWGTSEKNAYTKCANLSMEISQTFLLKWSFFFFNKKSGKQKINWKFYKVTKLWREDSNKAKREKKNQKESQKKKLNISNIQIMKQEVLGKDLTINETLWNRQLSCGPIIQKIEKKKNVKFSCFYRESKGIWFYLNQSSTLAHTLQEVWNSCIRSSLTHQASSATVSLAEEESVVLSWVPGKGSRDGQEWRSTEDRVRVQKSKVSWPQLSSIAQSCRLFATPWTTASQASLSSPTPWVHPNSCA